MTFPQFYLGPGIQRWQPRSAADVQAAIDNAVLEERHWLDVKRQLNNGPNDKTELARDAASFANEGGVLLYGVEENRKTGKLTLAPTPLAGLAERIEQIVHQRCDPPLFVQCHPIPASTEDTETGFLVVEIPPSPLAPHMVDGKYHGRGDKTKHVLTDTEVERLHAIRTARQASTRQLIDTEIARDPLHHDQEQVRFYGVALPLASPPELLTPHLASDSLAQIVERAVKTPDAHELLNQLPAYPEPRAVGRGWRTYDLPSRIPLPDPNRRPENYDQADLEIADNGAVTLYASKLSSSIRSHRPGYAANEQLTMRFLHTATAVAVTRALLTLAGQIGSTFGYRGQWHLAIGLTNLAGVADITDSREIEHEIPIRYSAKQYQQGTTASTGELDTAPGPVIGRLTYKLTRALGKEDDYANLYTHQAEPAS